MELNEENTSGKLKELTVFTQIESLNENIVLTAADSAENGAGQNIILLDNEYDHKFIRVVSGVKEKNVNRNIELHVCDKCNRTFKQKSRFDRHVMNHPSEKTYLCTVCNKTFTRFPHLQKHLKTHSDERKHICEVCGAAFILPHHLVRHNRIHTGSRPFECNVCHKQFTRKAGLTQHQLVHTGEKPYSCTILDCGKQFTDRTTLRRHVLTHTCEKPFICKECEKTFRTKSACRKHYLRHFTPDESFKCGICEEMFKSESRLREHSVVHEQRVKNGVYRCGFCLRVFKSQKTLDAHVTIHENGFIHKCKVCDAKFFVEKSLQDHAKTHENYNPAVSEISENCSMETLIPSSSFKKEVALTPDDYINAPVPSSRESTAGGDTGKLMMVLQLPNSTNDVGNNNEDLCFKNIQQYLENAHVDKLFITTSEFLRPECSNEETNKTVELKLSENQRNNIEKILQNANINSVNNGNEMRNNLQLPDQILMEGDEIDKSPLLEQDSTSLYLNEHMVITPDQSVSNANSDQDLNVSLLLDRNNPSDTPSTVAHIKSEIVDATDIITDCLDTQSVVVSECDGSVVETLPNDVNRAGDTRKQVAASVFTKPVQNDSTDVFTNILSQNFGNSNSIQTTSEKELDLNNENDLSSSVILASNEQVSYFL